MNTEPEVQIINKNGLHARPAAEIVKLATRFKSEITMIRDDLEVNGKSIMGLMMLGAGPGSTILVQASGKPLSGELRMSVIPTIAPFMLPRILPRLRKERPALKLFLREETTDHAIESLRHGRADCVLLALPFATGGT